MVHTAQKACSYGVEGSSSAWRNPLREVCQETKRGKTNVTREAYIDAMWERFGETAFPSPSPFARRSRLRATMEYNNTDVQFILDALVGSLATSGTEENLSCSKIGVSTRSEKVCQIVSPIGSFLSEIHEAKVHVFSDSVLWLGMQAMFDTKGNLNGRWAAKDHKVYLPPQKGINSNFLRYRVQCQSQVQHDAIAGSD